MLIMWLQGDVQMCSMLALVAGKELGISKSRATRFVESYIGRFLPWALCECLDT